jgi:hypothetical protein
MLANTSSIGCAFCSSDEKSDGAYWHLELCGIALGISAGAENVACLKQKLELM